MAPLSLNALAERYGTPLYVYDGAAIGDRLDRVRNELAYRPLRVLCSAKANPAVGTLAFMRRRGLGFDACSPGDLRLAELSGFTSSEISYTGFGSTDAELLSAADHVGDLVLDDPGELRRLAALGVRRPIGLRVNPEISAGFHAHVTAGDADAKFGTALDEIAATVREADRWGLEVQGLHAHLGSDVLDTGPHELLLRLLTSLAAEIATVRWVNLGGGFGTPRRRGESTYPWKELNRMAETCLAMPDGRQLELRIEPGAYLTMDAGLVLGRVVAIKGGSAGRPETVVTDVSTNHLVSVLLYDAHHPLEVVGGAARSSSRRYRVAGNLMQAGDVLAVDVELPTVAPGDLIALGHAGAYAASRAGTFNLRPRAAEVLIDGDEAVLLRRAETVEDLFARDCVGRR